MFPGIYDFRWDAGHIIFLGVFYSVLAVVLTTMALALRRALASFRGQRVESLRWHADFDDLPSELRRCRHELTGETASRECPNGFDCRHCTEHPQFVARGMAPVDAGEPFIAGFELPSDRLYHRGHTWVRPEADGTLTVGLDDFATRLIGTPKSVRLPAIGTLLKANGMGWKAKRHGVDVRILAPIDGEVVATGSAEEGWYLKVKPAPSGIDTRHLLSPAEAKGWMLREVERLQIALAPEAVGATLADGGTPLADLSTAIPREKLDDVYGMVFLHP